VKQKQRNSLSENQLQNFKGSLAELLMRHYQRHWYPELPHKGSGFRCIRINGRLDPLIEKASSACGLPLRAVKKMLPHELTMWIDPDEVSYRIGENGSICVLYDISHHRASPASDLDSTASSNGVGADDFGGVTVRSAEHIAMVSGDLMEEFFENSSARIVTKPKVRQNSYHQQQPHRNNASFNNSLSSTSSGQLSPPLSPPFNHNHQQQQHHHQNQFHQSQPQQFRQHHQHRYPTHPTMHQNQPQQPFNNHQFNNNYNNFMNDAVAPTTTQQPFYQWENSAFHSHHGNNNKVRIEFFNKILESFES
jgi:protein Tob/BTG